MSYVVLAKVIFAAITFHHHLFTIVSQLSEATTLLRTAIRSSLFNDFFIHIFSHKAREVFLKWRRSTLTTDAQQ